MNGLTDGAALCYYLLKIYLLEIDMEKIFSIDLPTSHGVKSLSVICGDVTKIDFLIDVLTTSSYPGEYSPTPGSLFGALWKIGLDMRLAAKRPFMDLRITSGIWLSDEVRLENPMIKRIGCIESQYYFDGHSIRVDEAALLGSIKSYFHMLDIASASGVKIDSVALPLLGTGLQRISEGLIITPLLNECVAFLKRNDGVKEVIFVERDEAKAQRFVEAIEASYSLFKEANAQTEKKAPLVFISYTTPNRNVADNLCFKLESRGIKVWYAPRNVHGPYAAAIANAIEEATHFVVILSDECMLSEHVLNEIDLAFKRLPNDIKFKPLRIDGADLTPSFNYYLSRQHWMDAHVPPLEERLIEFVESFLDE